MLIVWMSAAPAAAQHLQTPPRLQTADTRPQRALVMKLNKTTLILWNHTHFNVILVSILAPCPFWGIGHWSSLAPVRAFKPSTVWMCLGLPLMVFVQSFCQKFCTKVHTDLSSLANLFSLCSISFYGHVGTEYRSSVNIKINIHIHALIQ